MLSVPVRKFHHILFIRTNLTSPLICVTEGDENCAAPFEMYLKDISGVFRISLSGVKFSLATSAHTKRGEGTNHVFLFFLW